MNIFSKYINAYYKVKTRDSSTNIIYREDFIISMNQKQIGTVLIVLGILLSIFTYTAKIREDRNIDAIISIQGGSCYLPDGTCLHEDRSFALYIFGGILSASLIVLGLYLIFFDKTAKILEKQREEFKEEVKESKKTKEFDAFLEGFSDDEKKVIKTIHSQEGIQQSTLRYKTGTSKTGLSLMLKDLEERGIITRTLDGKTNKVYLRKKF